MESCAVHLPPHRIRHLLKFLGCFAALAILFLQGCTEAESAEDAPTLADYQAAAEAAAACLSAHGFDAVAEKSSFSDDFEISIYNIPPDKEQIAEAAHDECWAEHAEEIATAYNASLRLTGRERDLAMDELVACLEAVGVTGLSPAQTDSTVFVSAIDTQLSEGTTEYEAALRCMERFRNVWPPGDVNNP